VTTMTIGNTFGTITATNPGTASPSSGYAGASGQFNFGNACNVGAFTNGASPFYQVTLTPDSGFAVSLTGLTFGTRSTSTGPQAYTLRSSSDNYGTEIVGGTIANDSTWSLKNHTFTSPTFAVNEVVTLRVYTFGGTGLPNSGTINNRIDDFTLTVQGVNPVPEPATVLGLAAVGLISARFARRRLRPSPRGSACPG
jgi:hypothetical protein